MVLVFFGNTVPVRQTANMAKNLNLQLEEISETKSYINLFSKSASIHFKWFKISSDFIVRELTTMRFFIIIISMDRL